MNSQNGKDRREKRRRKLIRTGTIEYGEAHPPMPCVILDISRSGARLKPDDASVLPDVFYLNIKSGPPIACRVVRRTHEHVAVVFIKSNHLM